MGSFGLTSAAFYHLPLTVLQVFDEPLYGDRGIFSASERDPDIAVCRNVELLCGDPVRHPFQDKLATEITGTENATIQLFCTAAVVTVFVGCKQGLSMEIAPGDWLPILMLGLINTGVGCYFYFSSIGSLPAQTVAICGYLEPLSAVLLSVLILHETMTPLQIPGAILIIGGAVFGECYTGRRQP